MRRATCHQQLIQADPWSFHIKASQVPTDPPVCRQPLPRLRTHVWASGRAPKHAPCLHERWLSAGGEGRGVGYIGGSDRGTDWRNLPNACHPHVTRRTHWVGRGVKRGKEWSGNEKGVWSGGAIDRSGLKYEGPKCPPLSRGRAKM